ncbi:tumor necrosis factor ligand superfamily member 13B [Anolis carolinensis]|uniref:tumor necrosis factor ligand superfamily member 13B n=1 Tax=Anolis carolinensis TaxID=28377 RepID=UPI0004627B67|nr:PREDICTED: tumor necrosis factor ligand superfamily member 13B [Anolis carolinensis]|eukprot:XP_003215395.2 PREDICTED: tumor necrosis factor ligand superfamily member 13B [Anolis carolinensis]
MLLSPGPFNRKYMLAARRGCSWPTGCMFQSEKHLAVKTGAKMLVGHRRGKSSPSLSAHGSQYKGLLLILLGLAVLVSSCLAAVSLYYVTVLKTELALLTSKLNSRVQARLPSSLSLGSLEKRKEANPFFPHWKKSEGATSQGAAFGPHPSSQETVRTGEQHRRKRSSGETVLQSCLQLMADSKRNIQQNDDSSLVPWLLSFKRGTALEEQGNKILVRETGYFFIYGQVLYTDEMFVMGHLIQRRKAHVVGDDLSLVTLFRCIQSMPATNPNNSCYTAGIAKLEEGDELQLTIPRRGANIVLSGDATFFGAVRLL